MNKQCATDLAVASFVVSVTANFETFLVMLIRTDKFCYLDRMLDADTG